MLPDVDKNSLIQELHFLEVYELLGVRAYP
jgi:hypothetical protein